eukprot:315618-Amphidinium_carterae.1
MHVSRCIARFVRLRSVVVWRFVLKLKLGPRSIFTAAMSPDSADTSCNCIWCATMADKPATADRRHTVPRATSDFNPGQHPLSHKELK